MLIAIRRADNKDAARVLVLAENFHAAGGALYPFNRDRVQAFVSASILRPEMLCIVAGELPCGFLIASAGINHLTGERYAEEAAMWIEPDYRSAGLASAMIAGLEAWATAQKCAVVKLTAQHSMRPEAVARLYRKSGYAAAETAFIRRL